MNANEVVLYVADQQRSALFYAAVLELTPTLDVPGMTEFDLGGVTLGLMPATDIVELVPGLVVGSGQRCELYLRRPDAAGHLDRVAGAGGRVLADVAPRAWGEAVGYGIDPDGHVVAFAESVGAVTSDPGQSSPR